MNRFRKRDRKQVMTLPDMDKWKIRRFRVTQKRRLFSGTLFEHRYGPDTVYIDARDVDDLTL